MKVGRFTLLSRGWVDALLMTVQIAVIIVGLQAIGLILIVAPLVIPPASANF